MPHSWLWALVLTLVAALTWWLARDGDATDDALQVADTLTPPGFYIRRARLIGLDEAGLVLYRLDAQYGSQVEPSGPIELQEVTLDYTPAAEVPWRLEGRQARVPADRSEVELFDGVVATSTGDSRPQATIRTDSLRLDPRTHIAKTGDPVSVRTPEGTLSGVGMTANLQEDRLVLESKVHGLYTP
ncbi:MAG: LPS export ABC transporter periplasmic protein LptC [Gammaproteobacteria bacterium]|nr:LPS export ABC transporter periplasmic protein LptC [Gammaproteobacteria bacterium]